MFIELEEEKNIYRGFQEKTGVADLSHVSWTRVSLPGLVPYRKSLLRRSSYVLERDTSAGTSPLQAGVLCRLWHDKLARAIKMSVGRWHLGIRSIYLAQQV